MKQSGPPCKINLFVNFRITLFTVLLLLSLVLSIYLKLPLNIEYIILFIYIKIIAFHKMKTN